MANPRYYGKKDLDTFDRFNKELIGDLNNANSGIIDQTVIVYKISASNTETNMYGETSSCKVYSPGGNPESCNICVGFIFRSKDY